MSKPSKNLSRTREDKLTPVSNILQSLLSRGQSPLSDQFLRWRVWNSWSEIVGSRVCQYSVPVGFHHGILIVWVKTSAHLHDLSFALDLIRTKVNHHVGFDWIHSVRLTVDKKDVPNCNEGSSKLKEFLSK
ncbi:MAG: DUF721 domain-containing protein [Bdellovibrionales bacterium]|nr:DUF721 domain-containing protein [Bdellovibrionales bacterium]